MQGAVHQAVPVFFTSFFFASTILLAAMLSGRDLYSLCGSSNAFNLLTVNGQSIDSQ